MKKAAIVGSEQPGAEREPGATLLHLFRHGSVNAGDGPLALGQLDVELAPEGLEQHETLVEWMRRNHDALTAVWSSDLKRCRELAGRLGSVHGVKVSCDPRLREQSFGEWEGRRWKELTRSGREAVKAFWANPAETRPPGGESLRDVSERVLSWWREPSPGWNGAHVAVVTHAGVIRVLLCHFLGVPLSEALRFAPARGSHTGLALAGAGAVLMSLGERPWTGRKI